MTLVIGDSGTGKTPFAATYPKPYFLDFDEGTRSASGLLKPEQIAPFMDISYKGRAPKRDGLYEYGKAYPAFLKRMNEIGDLIDAKKWPYRTLVFDSATMLLEIMMNYILADDGAHGKNPQIQHWGKQINEMKSILGQLRRWPGYKIFTAHIQRDQNDVTKATEQLPLVTGKLAGLITIYFPEIYFMGVKTVNGERKSLLYTINSEVYRSARSGSRVPTETEAHYKNIKHYIT